MRPVPISDAAIKYGLLTGLGVCLYVLIEFFLGFHTTHLEIGRYSGYGSALIPIVTITLALRERRGELRNDFTVGKGWKTGMAVSFLTTILTTPFLYVYETFINPSFLQLDLDTEKERLLAEGMSEAEVTQILEQLRQFLDPSVQAMSMFIGTLLMGALLSLIIAALLRTRAER